MATVRTAGWGFDDDTGEEVFRVVVEYRKTDEPPTFPVKWAWDGTPVEIVAASISPPEGRP